MRALHLVTRTTIALLLACFAGDLTAQVNLPPADLNPGEAYRVLFVTNGSRDATSANIADYDAFVSADASAVAELVALATTWRAIASTPGLNARTHTGTGGTGVPVYRPDGTRLADSYDRLWGTYSTNLLTTPSITASGHPTTAQRCWTGCRADGTAHNPSRALGNSSGWAGFGMPAGFSNGWLSSSSRPPGTYLPLYGISDELTVLTCYEQSLGNPLSMGNNTLMPYVPLGFDFPIPGGGTTNTVGITSEGYLWLVAGSTTLVDPTPSTHRLNTDPARIAAFWRDLTFSYGGDVYVNTFSGRAVITWHDVQLDGGSAPFTVQLQMFESGRITLSYSGQVPTTGATLVGWGPGNNAVPGAYVDLTSSWDSNVYPTVSELFVSPGPFPYDLQSRLLTAFPNGLGGYVGHEMDCQIARSRTYGSGCPTAAPLALAVASGHAPVLGRTLPLELSGVPAASSAGVLAFGFTRQAIDFGPHGAPGCFLLNSFGLSFPLVVTSPTTTMTLPIPADPVIAGGVFNLQGVVVSPGINAFGVVTSNGLELTLGEL